MGMNLYWRAYRTCPPTIFEGVLAEIHCRTSMQDVVAPVKVPAKRLLIPPSRFWIQSPLPVVGLSSAQPG